MADAKAMAAWARLSSPMNPLSPRSHPPESTFVPKLVLTQEELAAKLAMATAMSNAGRVTGKLYPFATGFVSEEVALESPRRGREAAAKTDKGAALKARADYTDAPAAGQRTPRMMRDKDLMSLKEGIGPATF